MTPIEAAADAAPGLGRGDPPQERSTVLETAGLELAARAEELGEQLSREEGKPRAEAIGEVQRASQIFRFFAGEALRVPGEHVRSVRPGVDVDVLREPLGVVGIITPWNFPIAIPAWKIAPALAYGCTVVFKPAELVPASAWSLVEIAIARAGAPPGVLQPRGRSGERRRRAARARPARARRDASPVPRPSAPASRARPGGSVRRGTSSRWAARTRS